MTQVFTVSQVIKHFETLQKGQILKVRCPYCKTTRHFAMDEPIENLYYFANQHKNCRDRKTN